MHPEALKAYFHLRRKCGFKPAEAWRYAMAKDEGSRWRALLAKLVPVRTDC